MSNNVENMPLGDIVTRVRRIYNPKFKQLNNTIIDGVTYENYDGINRYTENDNAGDILRLRKLQLVGKDAIRKKDGKIKKYVYLYSGYIYNTPEETDPEITDLDKDAYPVCFETTKKLEDIAKDDIQDEIMTFLNLLSSPKNFEENGNVKYIGRLFVKLKQGPYDIEREYKYSRKEKSSSPILQEIIEKIQEEYLSKKSNPVSPENPTETIDSRDTKFETKPRNYITDVNNTGRDDER